MSQNKPSDEAHGLVRELGAEDSPVRGQLC